MSQYILKHKQCRLVKKRFRKKFGMIASRHNNTDTTSLSTWSILNFLRNNFIFWLIKPNNSSIIVTNNAILINLKHWLLIHCNLHLLFYCVTVKINFVISLEIVCASLHYQISFLALNWYVVNIFYRNPKIKN